MFCSTIIVFIYGKSDSQNKPKLTIFIKKTPYKPRYDKNKKLIKTVETNK